eukprot:GDKH01003293.1.p1 GENE.GDKH01003293.1~~GDKH01003293.1.p1  ORF type:complete len:413 (-),score=86.86 GDKH01003293.1:142-1380(-)
MAITDVEQAADAQLLQDAEEEDDIRTVKKVSFTRTTINITKCFVGGASLELPGAFKAGGLLGSLIGILVLAGVSLYTLQSLAMCGQLFGKRNATYADIGYGACGNPGRAAAWAGTLIMTIGVCGSYYVFIASTVAELFNISRGYAVLMVLLPLVVFSWLRHYRTLSSFSGVAVLALLAALAVVLFEGLTTKNVQPLSNYPVVTWSTYPSFIGNAAFLYLIHVVVLPMRNQMKSPLLCAKSLRYGVFMVTIVNVLFAAVVYMLYAEDTQGNILDNLLPGPVKIAVQVLMCVDLFFTSTLFLLPICEALEKDVPFLQTPNRSRSLRTGFVLVTALCAWLVPEFSVMSALSGGFGNNVVGFILPPIFLTQLKRKYGNAQISIGEYVWHGFIVTLGLAVLVMSLRQFVIELSHARS